jgi:hypothetical protein
MPMNGVDGACADGHTGYAPPSAPTVWGSRQGCSACFASHLVSSAGQLGPSTLRLHFGVLNAMGLGSAVVASDKCSAVGRSSLLDVWLQVLRGDASALGVAW